MAPKKDGVSKRVFNKGSWTPEEDRRLAKYIEIHGAKRWKTIAIKSGLNRCGKSCRLRWLNYLRPNIKRGNISDEEEDLIIRLHKLLGNRTEQTSSSEQIVPHKTWETVQMEEEEVVKGSDEIENSEFSIDVDEFFDFSTEGCFGLDWVNKFLELDDQQDPLAME
ncbi:hypothetical protein CXB51_020051 [Gossypium anomalum]|uniref:Uncharacterized protein n=1 Tax=Gossypium anomalum TaxID=47600 RepID=A0A8J6CTB2_9ROSI|nr:hypothetical protein CXB51_020051 [Gossypium anomalum]